MAGIFTLGSTTTTYQYPTRRGRETAVVSGTQAGIGRETSLTTITRTALGSSLGSIAITAISGIFTLTHATLTAVIVGSVSVGVADRSGG